MARTMAPRLALLTVEDDGFPRLEGFSRVRTTMDGTRRQYRDLAGGRLVVIRKGPMGELDGARVMLATVLVPAEERDQGEEAFAPVEAHLRETRQLRGVWAPKLDLVLDQDGVRVGSALSFPALEVAADDAAQLAKRLAAPADAAPADDDAVRLATPDLPRL